MREMREQKEAEKAKKEAEKIEKDFEKALYQADWVARANEKEMIERAHAGSADIVDDEEEEAAEGSRAPVTEEKDPDPEKPQEPNPKKRKRKSDDNPEEASKKRKKKEENEDAKVRAFLIKRIDAMNPKQRKTLYLKLLVPPTQQLGSDRYCAFGDCVEEPRERNAHKYKKTLTIWLCDKHTCENIDKGKKCLGMVIPRGTKCRNCYKYP